VLDRVLSFMMDALIVIPSLPLLILLSSMTKGQTSLLAVGIILVIFNWPFPARQIRAVALTMRERDFVNLAWFSGESVGRILWRQMVPYLRGWAVANFINTILVVVAVESSLAFLGLSNDNVPTIGTMIYWALKYQALIAGRWWWLLPPIISIILIFVGFFLLSNALADRLRINPAVAR
jgi:peptide/nickel transport system permease protein